MSCETVAGKFEHLSAPYSDAPLRREIIDAVANLEAIQVADLARLLARAGDPKPLQSSPKGS
jgi:2-methylcitrate dehydratase